MRLLSPLLCSALILAAAPVAAQVRIYCCDAADGRKVCGDFLPTACEKRAYEIRDGKGEVVERKEAPLTPEQQAARDAEQKRKEEAAKKAAEEKRRNQVLVSTYASDKDIDIARDKAVAEIDKAVKQVALRVEDAKKKKARIEKEKEFYKGKSLPAQLQQQIKAADIEIEGHQAALASKEKEKEAVRQRFEDDKKRYLELSGKKASAPARTEEAKPAEKK